VTRKSRRLALIAACGAVLALALGLILSAMSGSIVFFRSPTEVASQVVTLQRGPDQTVDFSVTDTNATVQVQYRGLLPDLFREGQGVVAEGTLQPGGVFRADTVLAKHDESYMPREVADALKAQGRWQEGKGMTVAPASQASESKASEAQPAPAADKTLGQRSER
jgi:cytochrome c-type biogenesis protein CcmE